MGFLAQDTGPSTRSWTVSGLTRYIRELFETDYRLQDVEVRGEISNFTQARSGHLYFTLKDDGAQLRCVMWRSAAESLVVQPAEGDAVVANGHVTVYEAGGAYQLYADRLVPAGRGDLALAFEQLKQRLAGEGLFDPEFKQLIPEFPQKIGIVTSADAAALRDILNVLQRRCPLVSVLIAPTLVQGPEAPGQIVRALQWLDGRDDVETIIVARGGGSIEDLWAFNDEGVVRAVFAASHPIISGVGHETDFTLTDFAADLRAPTPSAAAELAVPDIEEIRQSLSAQRGAISSALGYIIQQKRWQLDALVRSLSFLSPRRNLDSGRQRVDMLSVRLEQAAGTLLEQFGGRLALAQARLMAVSPEATLSRGYAIVRSTDGQIVRTVQAVTAGERLSVRVSDGSFEATVDN